MTPLEDSARQLELLAMRHAHQLEQFERANREFFASRISDRGDDYFAHFAERLAALVAENDTGRSLLFVVVAATQQIVGRVNITDIDQPALTELGFRVDSGMQGKGVATRGVVEALEIARERGVKSIMARVALDNPGSQRVVERCGFTATGLVDAPPGSHRTFMGYRIAL
ncbi:MAG: GNAT family N-acetyltransferase [Acidothermaceae bacterium]